MSYFCDRQKLVNDLTLIVLLNLMMFSCLSLTRISMAADIDDRDHQILVRQDEVNNHPLSQLMSSQEDMVQIAGYGEEKLSTVLITGSVLCEENCNNAESAYDHHQLHLHTWPLSGALVSVNCHLNGRKRESSLAQGFTDEFGDFIIDLPSNLHAIPNLDKTCSARVVRIPNKTQCRPAYVRRHKGLKLSSVGNGIRTYNAGRIRFQHLTSKPSQACIQKASNNKQMFS